MILTTVQAATCASIPQHVAKCLLGRSSGSTRVGSCSAEPVPSRALPFILSQHASLPLVQDPPPPPPCHSHLHFPGGNWSFHIPLCFILCFSPLRTGNSVLLFPIYKWCWRIIKLHLQQLCWAAIARGCFFHNRRRRSSESQETGSGNYSWWGIGS